MNKINFNLAMLSKEVGEGEMLTSVGLVEIGTPFRVGGQTYIKSAERVGHKYSTRTHQEEAVIYNCYTYVAGEYKVHANFSYNTPCIVKEV